MKCVTCGRDIGDQFERCQYCEAEQSGVRVLTPEEKRRYDGITIDDGAAADGDSSFHNSFKKRVFVKNYDLRGVGLFNKVLVMLAVAALAAFVFFVALPVALMVVGVGIIVYFVLSFFSR